MQPDSLFMTLLMLIVQTPHFQSLKQILYQRRRSFQAESEITMVVSPENHQGYFLGFYKDPSNCFHRLSSTFTFVPQIHLEPVLSKYTWKMIRQTMIKSADVLNWWSCPLKMLKEIYLHVVFWPENNSCAFFFFSFFSSNISTADSFTTRSSSSSLLQNEHYYDFFGCQHRHLSISGIPRVPMCVLSGVHNSNKTGAHS